MKEHYYFDNAATSWPKPETVYSTMDQFTRERGVSPGRAGHDMVVEAERMTTQTRRLLAEFFNHVGDPHRVVFTQNATDSLNTALYGVLNDGDHVVTTRIEHNAVLRPLNHLERDRSIAVTYVPRDAKGYVDPQAIKTAITPKTKLVVVSHASNVLGAVQDLAAIGAITREAQAHFIVDSCQSAGIVPIDMESMHIDMLAFTGHKALFGPMGIGGLVVREGIAIRPARVGGTGIDSASSFQPEQFPYCLEAGTLPVPGIVGLNAAQQWFAALGRQHAGEGELSHNELCRIALKTIETKEAQHLGVLQDAFRSMSGIRVHGPSSGDPRVATFCISVDGMASDQVGEMLDADHHVCVRTGLHCAPLVHEDEGTTENKGAVRISLGYFTDEDDVAQLIDGVNALP